MNIWQQNSVTKQAEFLIRHSQMTPYFVALSNFSQVPKLNEQHVLGKTRSTTFCN
jgi:hypothetical protein